MEDNQKNITLMKEVIEELQKHTKQINIEDILDDISYSLMEFTPKEVAHKYSVPFSAVEKLSIIINSKLSKSDEISLTLFLKKIDFDYDKYDFFDPRDMFFIIGSKLEDMSVEAVAKEENLSSEIVKYIYDLINIEEKKLFPGSLKNILRGLPDYDILILFKEKENWDIQIKFRSLLKKLSSVEETEYSQEIYNLGINAYKDIKDATSPKDKLKVLKDFIIYLETNYEVLKK